MKKITKAEVKLVNLESTDIITTSLSVYTTQTTNSQFIGARGYDDEEEEW